MDGGRWLYVDGSATGNRKDLHGLLLDQLIDVDK
jgi:hypothetical protein